MKNFTKLFAFVVLIGLLSSCGGKDDEDVTSGKLVGTWKYSSIDIIEMSIDGQDIIEYFVQEFGLSETEAQEFADGFSASAAESSDIANVTVEFKSDGTYLSNQPGEPEDNGTWTLSDDGKTLTIDDDVYTITSLTSSKLVARIDEESVEEGVTIKIVIEFSFTKA